MEKKKAFLLGAGIGVLSFVVYNEIQKKNPNPKVLYLKNPPFGYNGLTVPPFGIVIKESERDNKNLHDHEMIHWKQYQREGLFKFIGNYTRENKSVGYDQNKYEIEARFIEDDFCKTNYTQCVRSGISKTVSNVNFRK